MKFQEVSLETIFRSLTENITIDNSYPAHAPAACFEPGLVECSTRNFDYADGAITSAKKDYTM